MIKGKCSIFGGPHDTGMTHTEGLALYEHSEADKAPELFNPRGPDPLEGTSKRLKPDSWYIALRYERGTRKMWQKSMWKIKNPRTGVFAVARLVDKGPAEWTDRVVDLSPGVAAVIGVKTDDIVEVEEV